MKITDSTVVTAVRENIRKRSTHSYAAATAAAADDDDDDNNHTNSHHRIIQVMKEVPIATPLSRHFHTQCSLICHTH
jgi:hypothetical protein